MICEALDLNAENILDYGKQTNKDYLIYFHLSVLFGLVIPSENIVIPLILWMNKKDKIIGLKDIGANLLNFMIVLCVWIVLYGINIILPIIFATKISNGKMGEFYPNIIKLIK